MKKKQMLLLILLILTGGCKNNKKEINCIYKDDDNEKMKSYMRVTISYDNDIVLSEKLNAIYQFNSKEEASANYNKIEKILEQDETVKLRQIDKKIAAEGEKDVSFMQYDQKAKVSYYEQLGYTCG